MCVYIWPGPHPGWQVLSYEPINHDTPKMMLKLHDAETLRSLGKVPQRTLRDAPIAPKP